MEGHLILARQSWDVLREESKKASLSIDIITAFCKKKAFESLDTEITKDTVKTRLLVRGRFKDFIDGATDIEALELGLRSGWEVYLNLDLHAKVYIFDDVNCYLGSANLTSSGLGISEKHNIEIITKSNINEFDKKNLSKIFLESKKIDEKLLNEMKKYLDDKKMECNNIKEWNNEILEKLIVKNKLFFLDEIISSKSPYELNEKDKIILGIKENDEIDDVKRKFQGSKIYRWIDDTVDEEIYFGELTEKLHGAMINNPRCYRREIKEKIQNIFSWIRELDLEEFLVDRPRHSERIRRRKYEGI